MTKRDKIPSKLTRLGTARQETKGLPIGSKQESLVTGQYD